MLLLLLLPLLLPLSHGSQMQVRMPRQDARWHNVVRQQSPATQTAGCVRCPFVPRTVLPSPGAAISCCGR
jgi:hypothetical protein